MKKKIIITVLSGILCYTILGGNAAGLAAISGAEVTGVTSTGCSCHGPAATSQVTISIQLFHGATPVTTYTAGGSYMIRVTGTNTSSFTLPKFGYQVSAVKTSGTVNAGTLASPPTGHLVTAAGIKVVEQAAPDAPSSGTGATGTQYVVNIPWTAPIAGTGSVTIRGIINAINNNSNADAGDKWNNSSLVVTEFTSSAVPASPALALKVSPNPSTGDFNISIPAATGGPAQVIITAISGEKMSEFTIETNTENTINPHLPKGIYIITALTTTGSYTARMVRW